MILLYLAIAFFGYLLGSVNISLIISGFVLHDDVRAHGSGNAGATNVARVFGMKAGLITLCGDMLKTAAAGLLGLWLAGQMGLVIGCTGCLLGHCWPVFFRFCGGKGVAVSGCIGLLLDWRLFLILIAVFFLLFLLTRRVSVCSMAAALTYPIAYWLLHPEFSAAFCLCLLICVLVLFLHRENICRLLQGEEPRFQPRSKKEPGI